MAATGVAQATTSYSFHTPSGSDLWYNPSPALFQGSSTNETPLQGELPTSTGVGFGGTWKLPNGDCMAFYASGSKGSDLVDDHACNSATYEEWTVTKQSNGTYYFSNSYSDTYYGVCGYVNSYAYYTILTESGGYFGMECPTGKNETPGSNQEFDK